MQIVVNRSAQLADLSSAVLERATLDDKFSARLAVDIQGALAEFEELAFGIKGSLNGDKLTLTDRSGIERELVLPRAFIGSGDSRVNSLKTLEGITTLDEVVMSATNGCSGQSGCGSCQTRSCQPNC